MSQEEPPIKHNPTCSPTSPGLWLPNLALSPPFLQRTAPPALQSHPQSSPPLGPRGASYLPCLAGSQSSCATTEEVIRPFLNPLQAAAIDVPHKCILRHLPKTYRSYKRGRCPSIAPKMTFAPFPKKLQHKLGQRWAAKGSSFVPVMLEEKNNCWLSISQPEQPLQCHAKRISTSLYFFVDSYDFFIMACIKRTPLFRICSLFHIGKGKW